MTCDWEGIPCLLVVLKSLALVLISAKRHMLCHVSGTAVTLLPGASPKGEALGVKSLPCTTAVSDTNRF